MDRFHCSACDVTNETANDLREHFQSEFHLANVRLRVDGKRRITKGEFNLTRGFEEDTDIPTFHCKLCKKTFRSVQTLQSHVKSTAHLMNKEKKILARDSEAASMLTSTSLGSAAIGLHRRHRAHHKEVERRREIMNGDITAGPKVPLGEREEDCGALRCLFCGLSMKNIEESLEHLEGAHGFTIPLVEKCTDPEGLLNYLGRKINGLMCIVCNDKTKKSFSTLEAVRAHMAGCNHDRIILAPEYNEFFDSKLDDPAKTSEPVTSEELVVQDGTRVIFRRDNATRGLQNRHRETETQMIERKMITAGIVEEKALIKQANYELMKPELKRQAKLLKTENQKRNKYMMQQGVKHNALFQVHYDGEGVN